MLDTLCLTLAVQDLLISPVPPCWQLQCFCFAARVYSENSPELKNSWGLRAFSACWHLTLFLPTLVEKLFGFQGAVKGSKITALLLVSY